MLRLAVGAGFSIAVAGAAPASAKPADLRVYNAAVASLQAAPNVTVASDKGGYVTRTEHVAGVGQHQTVKIGGKVVSETIGLYGTSTTSAFDNTYRTRPGLGCWTRFSVGESLSMAKLALGSLRTPAENIAGAAPTLTASQIKRKSSKSKVQLLYTVKRSLGGGKVLRGTIRIDKRTRQFRNLDIVEHSGTYAGTRTNASVSFGKAPAPTTPGPAC